VVVEALQKAVASHGASYPCVVVSHLLIWTERETEAHGASRMCILVILLIHELQDIFEAEPNIVREDDSSVQRIIARLLVKISQCEITQFREDYDTTLIPLNRMNTRRLREVLEADALELLPNSLRTSYVLSDDLPFTIDNTQLCGLRNLVASSMLPTS